MALVTAYLVSAIVLLLTLLVAGDNSLLAVILLLELVAVCLLTLVGGAISSTGALSWIMVTLMLFCVGAVEVALLGAVYWATLRS